MTENEQAKTTRIQDVSYILKDFLKVIKVVYMYPENNPLPQSLKRSFAEKLSSLVEQHGDLRILVDKDNLQYSNETVFVDKSKEESLAGIFFDTGITNFTFKAGLDVESIYKLLEVFKEYLNSPGKNLDMVTALWEAQIIGFSFTTVEDIALAEYDGDFSAEEKSFNQNSIKYNATDIANDKRYKSLFAGEEIPEGYEIVEGYEPAEGFGEPDSKSSDQIFFARSFGDESFVDDGLDDDGGHLEISDRTSSAAEELGLNKDSTGIDRTMNTNVLVNKEYRMSSEDEKEIIGLVTNDANFDPLESTVELLKELLLQESELRPFGETVTICEKVINELIVEGEIIHAAQILEHLSNVQDKVKAMNPVWVERLKESLVTAGSRERLSVLNDSLNQHPIIGSAHLRKYLNNFDWKALTGLTELLGSLKHEHHRQALCDFLAARGKENLSIIARGISDKDSNVICSTVTVLSKIDDDRVHVYLEKVATHSSVDVRSTLVRELLDHPSEKATSILGQLSKDSDRDIRKKAITAIGCKTGARAFEAITGIINDETFESSDKDDQQLLLTAFSRIGGERSVTYLSQLILTYNLFRNSDLMFFRMAAFEALSNNKSERAEDMLVKLSGNWRRQIRAMATEAMHRRRSLMSQHEESPND